MNRTDQRIPLVYILSNGRSGSTLLDSLLGAQPGIWTVGEAHILPWEVRQDILPCSCGASVRNCDFWADVIETLDLSPMSTLAPIDYFREEHQGGRAVRAAQIVDILRGSPSTKWLPHITSYGSTNAGFLGSVWSHASARGGEQVEWLVDASKDVYRLNWLLHSARFDLRVLHLTKDPRGFVYSMTKRLARPSFRKTTRFAARWLVENFLFARICSHPLLAGRSMHITYERLATDPDQTIRGIGEWLGTVTLPVSSLDLQELANHAVAGNSMRWTSTRIRLDERWRTALPSSHQRVAWGICAPLARRLRYPSPVTEAGLTVEASRNAPAGK